MDNLTVASPSPSPSQSRTALQLFQVIQIIIAIVAMLGNLLVIYVITTTKNAKSNQTLVLIAHQSIADLFAALQIFLTQVELFVSLPYLAPYSFISILHCFLWITRLPLFGGFAVSTFNLIVLSLERYAAVIHPQWYIRKAKRHVFTILGLSTWILGPLMQVVAVGTQYDYADGLCLYIPGSPVFGGLLFLWEYLLPIAVMTFCYSKIVQKFKILSKVMNQNNENMPLPSTTGASQTVTTTMAPTATSKNENEGEGGATVTTVERKVANRTTSSIKRRNATKTLLVVYFAFIVCWTPNQVGFLQYNLGGHLDWNGLFYRIEIILVTANTCINVFIYAMRFKVFQERIKKMLTC